MKAVEVPAEIEMAIERGMRAEGYTIDASWSGYDAEFDTRRFWTAVVEPDGLSVEFNRISTMGGVPVYGQAALEVTFDGDEAVVMIPEDPDASSDPEEIAARHFTDVVAWSTDQIQQAIGEAN